MKTLMVTPFAPYRDGIATYALQELRRLRADGEVVDVLSPLPSAARWHLRLGGPTGMVQLGNKAAAYERTVLQFGPELLFGSCRSAGHRVAVWTALAAMTRRTALDIRIHEIEYGPLEQNRFERRAARLALDQADRVTVHTEAERVMLNEALGLGRRIEIVEHGRDFQPAVVIDKKRARAELGLPADQVVFLSIGFLQRHKGFDIAVQAMDSVQSAAAHLHVVGSARVDHPEISNYVDELTMACARQEKATLHRRFVSDVEFDQWLQAADAVVLPYREIWSSGVIERARLFRTPIVASDLAPLRDQAPEGTAFITDSGELAAELESMAREIWRENEGLGGGHPSADAQAEDDGLDLRSWDIDLEEPDRDAVQAQVSSRARAAEIATVGDAANGRGGRRPVDPLLALGQLHRPQPNSARPGVAPVKRLIDRLIGWQVDPLADRLEDLQRATVEAVAHLDRMVEQNDGDASEATVTAAVSSQTLVVEGGNDGRAATGGNSQ